MSECRFSQLSSARQALVRVLQAMNFGELRNICIRDSEPVIDLTSQVILDMKLDKEDMPRPELNLADFTLSAEVLRLISKLDELNNGTILRLEVRAGLPQRLVIESRLLQVFRHQLCERVVKDSA